MNIVLSVAFFFSLSKYCKPQFLSFKMLDTKTSQSRNMATAGNSILFQRPPQKETELIISQNALKEKQVSEKSTNEQILSLVQSLKLMLD